MRSKSEVLVEFGRLVARRRSQLGLSQTELAERLGFASPQMVSRYERGEQEPRLSALFRLADALDVGVVDLLPPASSSVADRAGDEQQTRLLSDAVRALRSLASRPDALALAVASVRAMAAVARSDGP